MSAGDGGSGSGKAKTSSQMEAVMRLMTGKEERTIAEKFADSNRPTWEQYKKDNKDKLNLEGVDEKKMQAYRQELDEQRDKILSRGVNHRSDKKKKKRRRDSSSSDSDDDDDDDKRQKHSKKSKKRKHRKKKHKRDDDDGSRSDDSDSSKSDDSRRKRKHKKKKHKHSSKSKSEKPGDEGVMDDRYRLSKFFNGSGSDD